MLVDVAYAVRQGLMELHLSNEEITAVLLHADEPHTRQPGTGAPSMPTRPSAR